MWFFDAAEGLMRDYDRENDHDGPRHFEYGLALMVGKLIMLVDEKRGNAAALKLAEHIRQNAEAHLRLLKRDSSTSARSAGEPPGGAAVNT